MGDFTSYQVDPDGKFQQAIDAALKESIDLRTPFTLIAQDFYRGQKSIFTLAGSSRYQDLSERYKKTKKKRYGRVYPILKANGFLEAAASVMGGSGNITNITSTSVEFGVDEQQVPYALNHQFGVPSRRIPVRKYFFIGPEEPDFANDDHKDRVNRWTAIIEEHITRKMAKGLA